MPEYAIWTVCVTLSEPPALERFIDGRTKINPHLGEVFLEELMALAFKVCLRTSWPSNGLAAFNVCCQFPRIALSGGAWWQEASGRASDLLPPNDHRFSLPSAVWDAGRSAG